VTAIAIGEYVYPDKLVVKPCGDFIWRIGIFIDPESHIVQKLAQFLRDTISIDTNILASVTVLPGPFPDTPEHALVQVVQKFLQEHITLALECPFFFMEDNRSRLAVQTKFALDLLDSPIECLKTSEQTLLFVICFPVTYALDLMQSFGFEVSAGFLSHNEPKHHPSIQS
jgi:hypothetical protein